MLLYRMRRRPWLGRRRGLTLSEKASKQPADSGDSAEDSGKGASKHSAEGATDASNDSAQRATDVSEDSARSAAGGCSTCGAASRATGGRAARGRATAQGSAYPVKESADAAGRCACRTSGGAQRSPDRVTDPSKEPAGSAARCTSSTRGGAQRSTGRGAYPSEESASGTTSCRTRCSASRSCSTRSTRGGAECSTQTTRESSADSTGEAAQHSSDTVGQPRRWTAAPGDLATEDPAQAATERLAGGRLWAGRGVRLVVGPAPVRASGIVSLLEELGDRGVAREPLKRGNGLDRHLIREVEIEG